MVTSLLETLPPSPSLNLKRRRILERRTLMRKFMV